MQSLFYFLIALALLIVIHEFGHFWVARRCGVRVLRFSVGFGKPIWSRLGKDGTEYVLAPIPMGGYVKMLDEREGEVADKEKHRAFNRQPLLQRFAIVAAGPVANLIFAILAYWCLFVIGVPGLKPVVDEVAPDSMIAQAGIVPGDVIEQVGGEHTPTWNAVMQALVRHADEDKTTTITVRSGGTSQQHSLTLPSVSLSERGQLLQKIGLSPLRPELVPVIGETVSSSPAEQAGLQAGDRLLSADGQAIGDWQGWVDVIQSHPGQTMLIEVMRDNEKRVLELTPNAGDDGKGHIGAAVDTSKTTLPAYLQATYQLGPVDAMNEAVQQTWLFTTSTLGSLWGMLTGKVSTDNLGGPISIAQIAGSSAEQGLVSFINFLAMISITLGILNLLPIPMLDGGHLAMFLIEAVRGKPLPDSVQIKGQQIGLFLLLMLMFLAFFNDLSRLFG
jgi:regulator of sigma E protease